MRDVGHALCLLALHCGLPWLVLLVAGMSLGMLLVYLVFMDVPMAIRRGYPWGDVSGLWWLAKTPTVALVLGMVLIRGALVWAAFV